MEYIFDLGEGAETLLPDLPGGPRVLSQGDTVDVPDGSLDHRPGFTRHDGSVPPEYGTPAAVAEPVVVPPADPPVVVDPPVVDPPSVTAPTPPVVVTPSSDTPAPETPTDETPEPTEPTA